MEQVSARINAGERALAGGRERVNECEREKVRAERAREREGGEREFRFSLHT
jgi:hypothetical protein